MPPKKKPTKPAPDLEVVSGGASVRLPEPHLPKGGGWSRHLENVAFLIGVALITSKGAVEILQDAALLPRSEHNFWAILLEFGRSTLLVAPKMLGRATAGKAWIRLGERATSLRHRVSRRFTKPKTPEDDQ